jgi:hypothetical protein
MQPSHIEDIRTAIAARHAEVAQVETAGPSNEEFERRVTGFFHHAASQGCAKLKHAVLGDALHDVLGLDRPISISVLAALLGPGVLTKATLKAAGELPKGIDAKDRAARLTALRAELDTLEVAEELEVCRLEALGGSVQRRGDARPEIVLAITDPDAIDADQTPADLTPAGAARLVQTAMRPDEPRLPRVAHSTYMMRKDGDE